MGQGRQLRLEQLERDEIPLGLRRTRPRLAGQLPSRFDKLEVTVSNLTTPSRRRNRRNAWIGWALAWPLLGLALVYFGVAWTLQIWHRSLSGEPTSARVAVSLQSQRPHALTWLEDERRSIHLLLRQLDLAQSHVDVDWHITEVDEQTQLKLFALTQIAKRGVKIRMRLDFADSMDQQHMAAWQAELQRAGIEVRSPRFPRLQIGIRRFWTRTPGSVMTLHAPAWLQKKWAQALHFQAGRSMQWIFDNKKWLLSSRADSRSSLFIEGEVVRGAVAGFNSAWAHASQSRPVDHRASPVSALSIAPTTSAPRSSRFDVQTEWSRWLRHVRQPQLARALDDQRRLCKDMLMSIEPATTPEARRLIPRLLQHQAQRTRSELRLEFPHLSLQDDALDVFQSLTQRKTPARVLMNPLAQASHPASVALGMSRLRHLSLTQTDVSLQSAKQGSPQHYLWLSDNQALAYGNFNLRRQSTRAEPELLVICRQSSALVQDAQAHFESRWSAATPVLRGGWVEDQTAWWSNASWSQRAMLFGMFPIAHWIDSSL